MGGIIPHQEIARRCKEEGLVLPFAEEYVRPSTYDLHLGSQYYIERHQRESSCAESPAVVSLLRQDETLVIGKYEIAFLMMAETVRMPADLTGTLALAHRLVTKGLLMGRQVSLDPGYEGGVMCMVHNLSDSPIELRQGDHILTIEFVHLTEPTDLLYPSSGGKYHRKYNLTDFVRERRGSGLAGISDTAAKAVDTLKQVESANVQMKRELERSFDREMRLLTLMTIIIAVLAVIATLMLGFVGYLLGGGKLPWLGQ